MPLYNGPKRRRVVKPSKAAPDIDSTAKILFWDIECTHLKADFGTVLTIGYKWMHEKKVHTPAITDYRGWEKDRTDDSRLLRDFAKVLNEADIIVTYNGVCFDKPYIQSKMLKYGIPLPDAVPHIDLYFTVKSHFCLTRKSLANVSQYLGLKNRKTPVTGDHWKRAATGDKRSIGYVVKHCVADVLVLEELYLKLRKLIRGHPRVNGYGPCRVCGSKKMHSRGYRVTGSKYRQRKLQCQGCGAWESRPL